MRSKFEVNATFTRVYVGIRGSTILLADCLLWSQKHVKEYLHSFAKDGKAFKLVRCRYLLGIVETYKHVSQALFPGYQTRAIGNICQILIDGVGVNLYFCPHLVKIRKMCKKVYLRVFDLSKYVDL